MTDELLEQVRALAPWHMDVALTPDAPSARYKVALGEAVLRKIHREVEARGATVLRDVDSLFPVSGFQDIIPGYFQQPSHHEAVIFRVLNQQHPGAILHIVPHCLRPLNWKCVSCLQDQLPPKVLCACVRLEYATLFC